MEIGGAERALAGLLSAFDPEKYSVDLFLFRHEGELMGLIPEGINLLPEKRAYSSMAVPIGRALRKLCFRVVYGRWRGKRAAAKYSKDKRGGVRPCDKLPHPAILRRRKVPREEKNRVDPHRLLIHRR